MHLLRCKLSSLLLMCVLGVAVVNIGCAEHHYRVYDPYYSDYHDWDRNEDLAYRHWLAERHYDYREYSRLDRDQQRDYWTWRHAHHDQDHDRDRH